MRHVVPLSTVVGHFSTGRQIFGAGADRADFNSSPRRNVADLRAGRLVAVIVVPGKRGNDVVDPTRVALNCDTDTSSRPSLDVQPIMLVRGPNFGRAEWVS